MHTHTTKALLTLCRVISLRLEKHPLCFVDFFFFFFQQKNPLEYQPTGVKAKDREAGGGRRRTRKQAHTQKKPNNKWEKKKTQGKKVSSEN